MKDLRNKIGLAVILAIFVAPIICCLPQTSFANSLSHSSEKTAMLCHTDSSQKQSLPIQICDCYKISPFLQSQDPQILKSFTSASFLLKHHLMAGQSLVQLVKGQSQILAFSSLPPSSKGLIPLYLKNSILRI